MPSGASIRAADGAYAGARQHLARGSRSRALVAAVLLAMALGAAAVYFVAFRPKGPAALPGQPSVTPAGGSTAAGSSGPASPEPTSVVSPASSETQAAPTGAGSPQEAASQLVAARIAGSRADALNVATPAAAEQIFSFPARPLSEPGVRCDGPAERQLCRGDQGPAYGIAFTIGRQADGRWVVEQVEPDVD